MSYHHRHFILTDRGVDSFELYAEVLRAIRGMPPPWTVVDRGGRCQAQAEAFDQRESDDA